MAEPKDVRINLTITEGDQQMLTELAGDHDISMSHAVRLLIRREHAERFGDKRTKRTKK